LVINLITLQIWHFKRNHFKENNGRAREESGDIRRGSEFITKISIELDFLLMDMSKEAEKRSILRKQKKRQEESTKEQRGAAACRQLKEQQLGVAKDQADNFLSKLFTVSFMLNSTYE
jgi:hypothetical protein